jgi:filamentous hemagglutinin family protein
MKPQTLLTIPLLIMPLSTKAQITTDGTFGSGAKLPGPNYLIGADLGRQMGGNLFHSFQDFNLSSHESATFSGLNSVQNVISRVTGGNPSNINGLIRSTIPNADMYFLNPYGIMFGPHARLDVQGSFHASTADYLRLGNGGRFDARQPSDSLLTVAPVEAFGFLTNTPAPITFQNSQLSVSKGKTLSLISGQLQMNGTVPLFEQNQEVDEEKEQPASDADEIVFNAIMSTDSGRINLVSVASSGEIILSNTGINVNAPAGEITFNNTLIANAAEEGVSKIFIRANKVEMKNSGIIFLGKPAFPEEGVIDILVTDLTLRDSFIQSGAVSGDGAAIIIKADNATLQGSLISSLAVSDNTSSQGGKIDIEAQQMMLTDDSIILSGVVAGEAGGDVIINVNNALIQNSFIGSLSLSQVETVGKAGDIDIAAHQMTLTDGATILNGTFGFGNSGTTTIKVTDALNISGVSKDDENEITLSGIVNLPPPNLLSEADILQDCPLCQISPNSTLGKTGSLEIEAGKITLTDGATISSATYGYEDGGSIFIKTDRLTISGTYVDVEEDEVINSSLNSTSPIPDVDAGNAGEIQIQAATIHLIDGGEINTSTENAVGGNITVNTQNLLYLREGKIVTSVHGGKGNGGNIIIEAPVFVVMDKGQIKAQANEGQGGNIRIVSDQFITSPDSLISADSRLGIDGKIEIDSPDINIDDFLVVLPSNFLDVGADLKKPCHVQKKKSRFLVKHLNGSPPSPYDWKSNRLLLLQPSTTD